MPAGLGRAKGAPAALRNATSDKLRRSTSYPPPVWTKWPGRRRNRPRALTEVRAGSFRARRSVVVAALATDHELLHARLEVFPLLADLAGLLGVDPRLV